MHGNESTTTKGLLDLFHLFREPEKFAGVREILDQCSLLFIPMLNPDGAAAYIRENSRGIDLNRDAAKLQEPESRILRDYFESFRPDFCLNLHDQRSIFGAGDTGNPATLSFLAPAMNESRDVNEERRIAMQVIASVNQELQQVIPGQVGRFDDAYNENCTGDYFQKRGIPTILFEAGHFPGDYLREKTREFFAFSLFSCLRNIISKNYLKFDVSQYVRIPENRKNFCDILLKNGFYKGEIQDLAIQFREKLKGGKICFLPELQKIDEQLFLFGHQEIDCNGGFLELVTDESSSSENVQVHQFLLNKKELSIKSQESP